MFLTMAAIQLPLLLFSLSLTISYSAAADPLIGHYCTKPFKGSMQKTAISHILSDLVAGASSGGGFATSSYHKDSITLYGLAQCRGDVSPNDCITCIASAARTLPSACPNQADARVWYDYCFMRYDTANFIGTADTGYALILVNVQNVTEVREDVFDGKVGEVMKEVRREAVAPGSGGLGRAEEAVTPYVNLYGLGQCSRDLEALMCAQCLSAAVEGLPNYCRYRKGCQIHYSSCTVRYEIYPFYFPLAAASASAAKNSVRVRAAAGEYSTYVVYP